MTLLRFLLRYSPAMVLWTSLVALLSGACNAGLIAMINAALARPGAAGMALLGAFVALGLGRILTNAAAQITLAHFSQDTTARLRQDLVGKILAVPLRQLEELGTPRLMVALTEDILEITQATLSIPIFAVNFAVLLGGAVYLAWLSVPVFLAMFAFGLVGAISYRLMIRSGFGHLAAARDGQDRLFRHFRALTEGVKELKLHRVRREAFLAEDVAEAAASCRRHNVAAEFRFILAQNWNQLLFLGLIGMILFLVPRLQDITPRALTGYIIATLYLMGPLAGLLGSLSVFSRANVSLRKVEELGLALTAQAPDHRPAAREAAPAFSRLELVQVSHHYHREREDDNFLLGPIDLSFQAGEVVFLIGGNGSGKSTLAKVITGLYPPAGGEIRLNGRVIGDHNRDDYRQLFSAVFADYFLFDRMIGATRDGVDARARGYLERLHLDHKVSMKDGVFSTTQLSQGQRKRLALLCAYLEDRPFYLFDEWASDQDPLFKDVFYTQLIPELKSRRKTVLAITHDDRYFSCADRLVKLDYGRITRGEPPEAQAGSASTLAGGPGFIRRGTRFEEAGSRN
ncbi:MAG TPA: cyclic peptide export ABC transporter [Opitutaceae bacterium]|nr:cyclic peptide export ABC transporter [Opitutaceae bacterium]